MADSGSFFRWWIGLVLITFVGWTEAQDFHQWENTWKKDSADGDWQAVHHLNLKNWNGNHFVWDTYKMFSRSLNLYPELVVLDDTLLGRTHLLAGLIVFESDLNLALDHFRQALCHYREYYPRGHPRITSVFFHLAEKSFLIRNIDDATSWMDSLIQAQWAQKKTKEWVRTLNLAARIYAFKGDVGRSDLFQVMNRPYIEVFDPLEKDYYINTMAGAYRDLFLPAKAIQQLQPILRNSSAPFYTFSQTGQAYLSMEKFDSAIFYLNQLLKIKSANKLQFPVSEWNWVYHHLSLSHLGLNDFMKAGYYLSLIQLEGEKSGYIAAHRLLKSKWLAESGKLPQALTICREIQKDYLTNQNISEFDVAQFLISYIRFVFRNLESQLNSEAIQEAVDLMERGSRFLDEKRSAIFSAYGRGHFSSFCRSFYDWSIRISHLLYQKTKDLKFAEYAIQYMESTRALLLYEEFLQRHTEQISKLKHRQKYVELQKLMEEANDSGQQLALSDSIFFWFRHETDPASQLTTNPKHGDFSYSPKQLGYSFPFLSYFQHEDSSLTVLGKNGSSIVFNHLSPDDWYTLFEYLSLQLNHFDPVERRNKLELMLQASKRILPASSWIPEKLLVIPDGILSNFPIETLFLDDTTMLIQKSCIGYSYSLKIYLETQSFSSVKGPTLIMAPRFNDDIQLEIGGSRNSVKLGKLEFNIDEALSISDNFSDGRLLIEEAASAENFLKYCGESQIIHIATHAYASRETDSEAQIIFSEVNRPNVVFLSDLYLLQIPAELVVISACQTAVGHYERGEGVMSIARAFMASGTKSVVASLWPVNDASTSRLMTSFHKYLSAGWKKDQALRQAKLDYLVSVDGEFRDPFYWAGFILIGDPSALSSKDGLILQILAGIIFLVSLLYLVLPRKKI